MSDLNSILGPDRITKPAVRMVVALGYDRFIVSPEDAIALLKIARRMTRVTRPEYDYRAEQIPQLEIAGDQTPFTVMVENTVVVPYGTWELRREQGDTLTDAERKRLAQAEADAMLPQAAE